jgi:hypothetical protein
MRGLRVKLTTAPPSLSLMSRQSGILYISQPCRPPRPVTGIDLQIMLVPHRKHTCGLPRLVTEMALLLTFNGVRENQAEATQTVISRFEDRKS